MPSYICGMNISLGRLLEIVLNSIVEARHNLVNVIQVSMIEEIERFSIMLIFEKLPYL